MLLTLGVRPRVLLIAYALVGWSCGIPKENPYPDLESKSRKKAAVEPDVGAAGSGATWDD
jgi:hypothetical protein